MSKAYIEFVLLSATQTVLSRKKAKVAHSVVLYGNSRKVFLFWREN
jgi:hypothetical protein